MQQRILITGSSSGFGYLTALALHKKGHIVLASMREPDARNRSVASELKNLGIQVIELDVGSDASVERGVAQALDISGGIDTVVNNAGVGVLGLQETFSPDDWRKLFEINVFGVQRVNRAVLPAMRKQRSGLLIHISSLLGRFVMPFMGPYNASKYALEALAESYRVELSGFGIESVIVEPGAFATDFKTRMAEPSDAKRSADYGSMAQGPAQQMAALGEHLSGPNAPKAQWVADAVVRLVELPAGTRPLRTVVDGLGMGEHVEKYNAAADALTKGIYTAFGMGEMLNYRP